MPRIGEIELLTAAASNACGAAFTLASGAPANASFRLGGAEIELRSGQRDAVVRFAGATGASETYERGHAHVQQGLDLISMLGGVDAVIADAENEHMLWWTERGALVLQVVSPLTFAFRVGVAAVEVRDSEGKVVPPAAVIPQYHVGFRYYRLAQVTDDLYDAYRNMYLAFEVLLSNQFPLRDGEREGEWLKRALRLAATDVQIADLVPQGTPDVVRAVLDLIYYDARLPLFHAKQGRDFYLPQDSPANREVVSQALRALTLIVLRMAESWFKVRRARGSVSLGFMYQRIAEDFRGSVMMASGGSTSFDPEERDLSHPRFRDALQMATRLAPELQRGSAPSLLGSADDLARLPVLRRVDLVSDQQTPQAAVLLESECVLDGVARLEVVAHTVATNASEPRSLFKT
jgi:hypothetical protein